MDGRLEKREEEGGRECMRENEKKTNLESSAADVFISGCNPTGERRK